MLVLFSTWIVSSNSIKIDKFVQRTNVIDCGHGTSSYMFSGRPSVPLSVRPSVHPSVIHVLVLCFRDISSIC